MPSGSPVSTAPIAASASGLPLSLPDDEGLEFAHESEATSEGLFTEFTDDGFDEFLAGLGLGKLGEKGKGGKGGGADGFYH